MSLALYRRYRPESFSEVIGQEHVTGPLQQALRNDRVHHAYLFSGPRGCGKTTSARILARALNCEQGPTPEPCGVCSSCQALARSGPGSLDVIEIDAASHGGVDDARDLRERAFFAPASSRYKIYIVDEAHMVSMQGFNALLKLVEEPPEHVKFVFATTEPEKVIGTIRSRTHHYPFRLVPPGTLTAYLADLCTREGITVDATVLPLVVRAGGGSVRDSLSVLDQLLSGAGDAGVTYQMATALLGYTDSALLDAVVDAFAASDGAAAFELVDRVVEAGHDPRRFVADLLDRVRDLMLVDAVPDAVEKGLVVGPPEQVAGLAGQAARFGSAELVRAAEILNLGLTEMRGATAPRMQLELICARVLLPGVGVDEIGVAARVDRLERRLAIAAPGEGRATAGEGATARAESGPTARVADTATAASSSPVASGATVPAGESATLPGTEPALTAAAGGRDRAAVSAEGPEPESVPPQMVAEPEARLLPVSPALDIIEIRRQWPAVLDAVKAASKVTWMMMFEKVTVASADAERIVLAFPDNGTLKAFMAGARDAVLRDAVIEVLGLSLTVDAILDPSRAPTVGVAHSQEGDGSPGSSTATPRMPRPRTAPDGSLPPTRRTRSDGPQTDTAVASTADGASTATTTPAAGTSATTATGTRATSAAPPERTSPRREPVTAAAPALPPASTDDTADPDTDPDDAYSDESPADLLARTLGAVVVDRVSDG